MFGKCFLKIPQKASKSLHIEGKVIRRKPFFSNDAKSGALFTLWMVRLGAVYTKDMLVKFGVIIDGDCYMFTGSESVSYQYLCVRWRRRYGERF